MKYTKSYYVERIEDVTYVRGFSSETSAEEFFTEISKKISFSDCTGSEILEICWLNKRVWYDGWKPANYFLYCDIYKNPIWQGHFPEFEH